jgi:ATP phosphoribosyltransferase regulatory subunit
MGNGLICRWPPAFLWNCDVTNLSTLTPTLSAAAGQIPRGVADYFWQEAHRRRELEQGLLVVFRAWGYGDVIPPSFEYADTIARRGSAELQAELCRFLDRDGSMLALRADMTIAVARLVGTRLHDWSMPQRFCYAGSVFRDVEPRAGQQREFRQAGIELIGSASHEADAEVLALTAQALQAVGLADFRIVLGQMQYFNGLLQALELTGEQQSQLQAAVDRNSEAELAAFLAEVALPAAGKRAVTELPALSGSDVTGILDRAARLCLNATMQAAVDNLRAISGVLAAHGVLPQVSLDLTEIHNLGYYTGITFEVLAPGIGYRLASGGRYDNLVGSFGAPQPAVGAAFGLERLLLALEDGSDRTPAPLPADVLVAGGDRAGCILLINRLRGLGLTVVVDLQGRRGESLWQLAQQQRIGCALDYGEPTSLLWMDGGAAGASCAEWGANAVWQQLQRLALAKAAGASGEVKQ